MSGDTAKAAGAVAGAAGAGDAAPGTDAARGPDAYETSYAYGQGQNAYHYGNRYEGRKDDFSKTDFKRDAPLLIMVSIIEILICGAACRTGAIMFRTRRHQLRHPASDTGKGYVKVGPLKRRGRCDFDG